MVRSERYSTHLEIEPLMMITRIRVRIQNQIVFIMADLKPDK